MQSNSARVILVMVVVTLLIGGAFSGGVLVGWLVPVRSLTGALSPAVPVAPTSLPNRTQPTPPRPLSPGATPAPAKTATSSAAKDTTTLFRPFWQAWDIVHQQYVDQPVDNLALMRGAIRGMVEALGDPHSSYMDPKAYEAGFASLNSRTYDGIGAWVDITGEYLRIISPMPDSPAQKAGLLPGDLVIAVDNEDMSGQPGEVVLKRVLGDAGTTVKLTIVREGAKQPFDVSITRTHITVPLGEGKMLDGKVAYIRLYVFGDTTREELRKFLQVLLPQKPVGLILDLRNNGGGYLETAIQVSSEFIKSPNVVMYEEHGDGSRNTYTADPDGLATDIPLVVLVNQGSASASEIVAGAIQDYGRGKLVGMKTYGKGSVQEINLLKDDGGALRVTAARWLTPKDRQINKVGLAPDVVVDLTAEDLQNKRDPQMDKAVELLTTH